MKIEQSLFEKSTKNNFMIQQSQIKAFPPAYPPDIESLRNWHHNHGGSPVDPAEQVYLTHTTDLFCVVPKDRTPVRRFLDRSREFRTHSIWRKTDSTLPSYDKGHVIVLSDKRIDKFVTFLIVSVGTAMLIAPIWILRATSDSINKLVVITVFIVVFLAILSVITVAKPAETLAATAAYSAVLMVFLQLGGPDGS
ncbi:hypothetical protein VTL71DRAFT_6910 [Oculimacula yallundae]|uniref:DUF6594 domain-containing protein n=1 Tax=Oculimacula yallundae TaxID=86028 RepID=A0ABR4BV91_9HELO